VTADGYVRLENPSTGSALRGRVICLKAEGNRAVIAGVVTSSVGQAPGEPVGPGDSVLLFAEDHGQRKPPADALSVFTFPSPAPSEALCDASESGPPAIAKGRIVVRDRR
jgi:hypothetical protein